LSRRETVHQPRQFNKPIRHWGDRVKRKGLSVFLLLLGMAFGANSSASQPVTPMQLMAWVMSGVPGSRLIHIVQERGMAGVLGKKQIRQLESAGAGAELIQTLTALKRPAGNAAAAPIPAFLAQAAAAPRDRRFHEAELALRQGLAADQENSALHFALGAMLRDQEQWDDAFDEFTLAADLMPDLPENHTNLAYIFYRLDDGPNAIAEARTALSMDPQNAEAYRLLGLGLGSMGQYVPAIHALMESLARDVTNADTYYDLGLTLHGEGDDASATASYRQAIHLKPVFWQAHSDLALVLHEEGKLDEAIAEYREAKNLAPEEASIRNNLGNTYCDKGDFDAAVVELRELYRQHPDWQDGHGCLARAYLSKKDLSGAIAELQIAVRQNPTSSADHRVLGETMLMANQVEEGVRELRLAVTLDPDSDAAHHALGAALFQQQQLNAAEKEFREALRLNSSPDNHYALAACLMTMDRYEEALGELETAARLDPARQLYRARREELMKLMKESNPR